MWKLEFENSFCIRFALLLIIVGNFIITSYSIVLIVSYEYFGYSLIIIPLMIMRVILTPHLVSNVDNYAIMAIINMTILGIQASIIYMNGYYFEWLVIILLIFLVKIIIVIGCFKKIIAVSQIRYPYMTYHYEPYMILATLDSSSESE